MQNTNMNKFAAMLTCIRMCFYRFDSIRALTKSGLATSKKAELSVESLSFYELT